MNQSYSLLNENISELLKMSKQFQNNMRQELSRQEDNSPFVAESCFSVWDDSPNPCLRDVVADCLDNVLNSNGKSVEGQFEAEVEKSQKQIKQAKSNSQVTERRIPPGNEPVLLSKKAIRPQYQSKRPNMPVVSSKPNIESSKSTLKPSTSTTTVHRLPLQRFSGTLGGSIDFSKEHPDLELDISSSRTTLFPRRFYRGTKLVSPERESVNLATAEEKAPINKEETWKEVLANNPNKSQTQRILRLKKGAADLDTCKMAPVSRIEESKGLDIISTPGKGLYQIGKQSEMLMKLAKYNQQNFPVMYVRPEYQVQRMASIEIHGDNQTIQSAGQHFSMNIKYVECTHEEKQDNEVKSSSPKQKEHVKHSAIIPNVEPVKDPRTPKEKNKYFKALEITELLKSSSISADYSSKSSSKRSSRFSSSSEYSRHSLKSKETSSTTSLNDAQDIIEQMLSSSERPLSPTTKESKGTNQTLRDVYVQTENKRKPTPPPTPPRTVYVQTDSKANAATSPTPPRLTPPRIISTPNHIKPHQPTDVSPTVDDIYVDEDLISKIFDRIHNDLPNALQAFKTRNTTTPRKTETINEIGYQAQMHKERLMDHYQTFTPNVTSNVEIEPRLSPIQVHPHTMLEMPPPAQNLFCDLSNTLQALKARKTTTPRDTAPFHFNEKQEQARMHTEHQMNYYQTSTANDTSNVQIEQRLSRVQVQPHTMLIMAPPVENSSFQLLQQNPLFARTINKIKSSTVDGTTAIDNAIEETHGRLTDAEIKRAVKVFLESLDGDEERKSFIRDGGDGTRVIRSRYQLPRSGVMTFSKTDSSAPSKSSSSSKSNSFRVKRRNVKKQINLPDGCGLSRSSATSSVYSSDLETESDVTIDQQSNKATENSLSEGEVLSMGEVA